MGHEVPASLEPGCGAQVFQRSAWPGEHVPVSGQHPEHELPAGDREASLGNLGVVDNTPMAAGVGGMINFAGKYTSVGTLTTGGYIKAVKTNATTRSVSGS